MGDTIMEASKHMGLSEHILRYYEKEGLLSSIGHGSSGCHSFQENGYEWVEVILCLKNTGTAIKRIRRFMDWCKGGDSMLQKRLELFSEQERRAEQQMCELEQHIERIEKKIWFYETVIKAGTAAMHNGKSRDNYDQAVLFSDPSWMIICHIFAQPICGVNLIRSVQREASDFRERLALSGDITTPIAIISGGLVEILTVCLLRQKGIGSIVFEANRIGSGQTQNITAKITSQHNLAYTKLFQDFSEEETKQYAFAGQQATGRHRQMITQEQIDCQLKERPTYLYSVDREDVPALEMEVGYACRAGIHAELTKKATLPFEIATVIQFDGRAQLRSLEFSQTISESLTACEKTKVLSVKGKSVMTDRGIVTMGHIVFASHLPFVNTPGYYFMRMYQERGYVLTLQNTIELDGIYLGIGEEGFSVRNYGDILLLGRGDHRTGENKTGRRHDMLRGVIALLYPQSKELTHWSAQDRIALDSIPYIGQFSSSTPNQYVATGFSKQGMTSSMVSVILLSDQITGDENPFAPVFSPSRFMPGASTKSLLSEIGQAVEGLVKQVSLLLDVDSVKPKALPDGHGGMVIANGKKAGAYREEQGDVTAASVKCLHLGHQLEWSPDEKSWDCPYHGSRFDAKGGLLGSPAQADLEETPA